MSKRNIYLAVPMGGASLMLGTHRSILDALTCQQVVTLGHESTSLLPFTFNVLWCNALNARHEHDLTHFVMIHSDIAPLRGWLDRLIELFDENQLDVLSVVSPIKSRFGLASGLTSTAVDTDPWRPRRITMTEFSKFPRDVDGAPIVWGNKFFRDRYNADLLFNTGLMCVRLDRDWSTEVCFDLRSRIVLDESGKYHPQVEPEDWRFSRWCHSRKLRVAVTPSIELGHEGHTTFPNKGVWGHPIDPMNITYVELNAVTPVVEIAGGK